MRVEVQEDEHIAVSEGSFTNKPQVFEEVKPSAPHPSKKEDHSNMRNVNFDLNCDHHNATPVISQEEDILPGSTPMV
jgi:hypothetical protein